GTSPTSRPAGGSASAAIARTSTRGGRSSTSCRRRRCTGNVRARATVAPPGVRRRSRPAVVKAEAVMAHSSRGSRSSLPHAQPQRAHVTTFDRLWSCLPYLRPMVTITNDTLPTTPTANGGRCHDLLGSRCDPYLYKLLDDRDYDVTCHNNLSRAVAPYHLTELDVHDVLNVFQVTGLDPKHEIYFMEPSPARKGDFFEFFAEIDLLCAISTCPSGDLSNWGW